MLGAGAGAFERRRVSGLGSSAENSGASLSYFVVFVWGLFRTVSADLGHHADGFGHELGERVLHALRQSPPLLRLADVREQEYPGVLGGAFSC